MNSRIYAIGDVHGRSNLLGRLIDTIEQNSRIERCEPRVFFLGDFVDRGPNSRSAMDTVVDAPKRWPDSRLILGNHDHMFFTVVMNSDNHSYVRKWLRPRRNHYPHLLPRPA